MDLKNSHSEVEAFKLCERRHFYGYGLRLRHNKTSIALARGTLGHEVLAVFYQSCLDGDSFKEAKAKAYQALAILLTESEGDYPDGKLREDLSLCFRDYFKVAEAEFDRIEVVAVEQRFDVRINEYFTLPFVVDLILYYDGRFEAWDHKFVWDFFNPRAANLAPQLPLYYSGLRMLDYPHATVRYNEIRYRYTDDIKADYRNRINRPAPRISAERVLTTMDEHIRVGKRIAKLHELSLNLWEEQTVRVGNTKICQSCDFARICEGELNGEPRDLYVGVDYVSKD